ncbi:hypothetical protein V1264_021545 [Littorina saxatilis]|uniref:Uncharacterized protein n=1 Tax=Littorina saxatilis TaxID=31220 RepID=A0AAN9AIF3_9CAEN
MRTFVLTGAACGLVLLFALCQAEVGHKCTAKSECAADECCQIINIVVASKKRQLHPLRPVHGNEEGTCQKYKTEGASCVSFDVLNGFCGCASGLTCHSVYVGTPTPQPVHRRDMRPGYASFCTANAN